MSYGWEPQILLLNYTRIMCWVRVALTGRFYRIRVTAGTSPLLVYQHEFETRTAGIAPAPTEWRSAMLLLNTMPALEAFHAGTNSQPEAPKGP